MLRNKLIVACLMACSTAVVFASSAPVAAPIAVAAPMSIDITSCTGANGALGDANAPIRDFCLSQTHHIHTGQVHHAMHFAAEYYKAVGCTSATSVIDGNCKKAANTLAEGITLSFHLNYHTLHKLRNATPAGTTNGCYCSS
ncbi:MAG: hypothetical protein V4482_02440 [Pseudomonadota bacterium]